MRVPPRYAPRGSASASPLSPDGRWLAFVAEHNGNQELYKVRANGRGMVQLTTTYGITEAAPRWQRVP